MQLLGKAERMQVPDAEIGLTQNIGGSGSSSFVSILRRVK
jgi:acetyl-CoA C-acetyltransferase